MPTTPHQPMNTFDFISLWPDDIPVKTDFCPEPQVPDRIRRELELHHPSVILIARSGLYLKALLPWLYAECTGELPPDDFYRSLNLPVPTTNDTP